MNSLEKPFDQASYAEHCNRIIQRRFPHRLRPPTRYEYNLDQYLEMGVGTMATEDKEVFLQALEDVVLKYLHEVGVEHNDIRPGNVMVVVSAGRVTPVLTGFGMARKIGERLPISLGKKSEGRKEMCLGWRDEGESYETSEVRHDVFALGKMKRWLAGV